MAEDHHYISQLLRETIQQTLDRLLLPDGAKDQKDQGPNVTPDEKGLHPKATPFTPSRTVQPVELHLPHRVVSSELQDTRKALIEALSLQKLPNLTPKIFKGEELEFLRWESSFDALLGFTHIDAKAKLHYLYQFLDGEPLNTVEHYQDMHKDSDVAYRQAREELKFRYGNPSVLTSRDRERSIPRAPQVQRFLESSDNCDAKIHSPESFRQLQRTRQTLDKITWMGTKCLEKEGLEAQRRT